MCVCKCMRAGMCVCACVCKCTHMCVRARACVCARMHTSTWICVYVRVRARVLVCVSVYLWVGGLIRVCMYKNCACVYMHIAFFIKHKLLIVCMCLIRRNTSISLRHTSFLRIPLGSKTKALISASYTSLSCHNSSLGIF